MRCKIVKKSRGFWRESSSPNRKEIWHGRIRLDRTPNRNGGLGWVNRYSSRVSGARKEGKDLPKHLSYPSWFRSLSIYNILTSIMANLCSIGACPATPARRSYSAYCYQRHFTSKIPCCHKVSCNCFLWYPGIECMHSVQLLETIPSTNYVLILHCSLKLTDT